MRELKARYVREYKEREKIKLVSEQIQKNPGRKTVVLFMLNSFWGKFGEYLNKTTTQQITTPHELFQPVNNPLLNILRVRISSKL